MFTGNLNVRNMAVKIKLNKFLIIFMQLEKTEAKFIILANY